jgi:hypothetical protein
MQIRKQSEKTRDMSSWHEKNNGYLGLSKRSFMPQLWEKVRPHFDTYSARMGRFVTRDAFSKSVPCESSIIWSGGRGKDDAGITYIEH